jgi:hypothetical protein
MQDLARCPQVQDQVSGGVSRNIVDRKWHFFGRRGRASRPVLILEFLARHSTLHAKPGDEIESMTAGSRVEWHHLPPFCSQVQNPGYCQVIKATLVRLETIGRTEPHSIVAMEYEAERFPTLITPHRFRKPCSTPILESHDYPPIPMFAIPTTSSTLKRSTGSAAAGVSQSAT